MPRLVFMGKVESATRPNAVGMVHRVALKLHLALELLDPVAKLKAVCVRYTCKNKYGYDKTTCGKGLYPQHRY